jgi:hypothetical protein
LARDIQRDIGAVLVVRHNGFYVEAALAEFLHRKTRARDRGWAIDVAECARHIGQDADLDGVGGLRFRAAPWQATKGCCTARSGQD